MLTDQVSAMSILFLLSPVLHIYFRGLLIPSGNFTISKWRQLNPILSWSPCGVTLSVFTYLITYTSNAHNRRINISVTNITTEYMSSLLSRASLGFSTAYLCIHCNIRPPGTLLQLIVRIPVIPVKSTFSVGLCSSSSGLHPTGQELSP